MSPADDPAGGPPVPDVDWAELAERSTATALLSGTTLLWVSAAAGDLLGTDPARLTGTDALDLLVPADRGRAGAALERALRAPDLARRAFPLRLAARPDRRCEAVVRSRGGPHLVLAAWDVTVRSEEERELRHRAGHDPLTGLPNRALLDDRWARARDRSQRAPGRRAFLLVCDVDGLKEVNDTAGHRAGDDLLVLLARRLAGEVRPSDTVARVGGDEFVVLVEDVPVAHVRSLADRLRRSLTDVGRGPARRARLSVGWVADDPARSREAVLAEADALMYEDKRAGGTGVRRRDAGT